MPFRTTLFRAIAAADVTLCNGSALAGKLLDASTGLAPFVDLADGTSLTIGDDEITIDGAGRAYTARPDSGAPLVWSFRALQPLTPACVETIAPPAPTVGDMIVRIKRLGAAARRHALT